MLICGQLNQNTITNILVYLSCLYGFHDGLNTEDPRKGHSFAFSLEVVFTPDEYLVGKRLSPGLIKKEVSKAVPAEFRIPSLTVAARALFQGSVIPATRLLLYEGPALLQQHGISSLRSRWENGHAVLAASRIIHFFAKNNRDVPVRSFSVRHAEVRCLDGSVCHNTISAAHE